MDFVFTKKLKKYEFYLLKIKLPFPTPVHSKRRMDAVMEGDMAEALDIHQETAWLKINPSKKTWFVIRSSL